MYLMNQNIEAKPKKRELTDRQYIAQQRRIDYRLPNIGFDFKQKLMQSYRDHLHHFDEHIQYAVTLQTNFVPAERPSQREWQFKVLKENFTYFANRLNAKIYKNGFKRKPDELSLLIIPVIQGALFSPYGTRTLHYHVALGNVPPSYSEESLNRLIKGIWKTCAVARDDVLTKPAGPGWQDYITAEVDEGHIECVDYDNWNVPIKALSH